MSVKEKILVIVWFIVVANFLNSCKVDPALKIKIKDNCRYDLAISECKINPTEPRVGSKIVFTYKVKNLGDDVPIRSYDTIIIVNGIQILRGTGSPHIFKGMHTEWSMVKGHYHFIPARAGKYKFSILIDPKNILNDVNKKNNRYSGVITVKE